jgi:two-component system KDP operon response regulator KdpE
VPSRRCSDRGYAVETVGTGAAALTCVVRQPPPDLMVLDLGLPDIDGTDVCRRVRAHSALPIIVLSARADETDKVGALECGADDYITKPFGADELVARIRMALKRVCPAVVPAEERLRVGDLTLDYARRRLLRGDEEIRLTPKEFDLLALLIHNRGRVMTHRVILNAIWGPRAMNEPEHLWVYRAAAQEN